MRTRAPDTAALRAVPAALASALHPPERIATALLHSAAGAALHDLVAAPWLECAILALACALFSSPARVLGGPQWGPAAATALLAIAACAGAAALASACAPGLAALGAFAALHLDDTPAAERLRDVVHPASRIPVPDEARDWVSSAIEALGIALTTDGDIDMPSLAAALEKAPPSPIETALDAGLAALRGRLAEAARSGRMSPSQLELACALAAPDPPPAMWREVLAAAIREADPEAVRRDLALLARLHGAERPPALSRRDTAALLYRHRRALARERERAVRS